MLAGSGGRMTADDSATVVEVFARVRARDDRVADLYAPDATLTADDAVYSGRDAIREFYRGVFANGSPKPVVRGLWHNATSYAALIEAQRGAEPVHAVDVFDVVDGVIRLLRIYQGALTDSWVPQPDV